LIPTLGRIVHYALTTTDADAINRRRQGAQTRAAANRGEGIVVHTGNVCRGGDIFPMIITRIWSPNDESSEVNGQLFLDGNDTLWVTSIHQSKATALGCFTFPEFVSQKQSA
jgi:hypothetical protein